MIKKISYIFSKKEKYIFLKLILALNVGVFLEMLSIGVILPLLSTLLNPKSSLDFLSKYNIEILSITSIENVIYYSLFLVSLIFLLKNICLFFLQKYQARILASYNENLTNEIYKKYLDQPIKNLMQYNTSFLSRNIVEVTNLFSNHFLQSLLNIVIECILLIGILSILLMTQMFFTIIALFVILPVGIIIYKFNKNNLLKAGEESKFHWGERLKQIQQTFSGILEVKSFSKEDNFFEKFKFHNKKLANVSIKLSIINITPKLIFEFIIILIICSGVLFMVKVDYNLIETIPIIGLFSYAFIRISPSLNKILVSLQRIKYSSSVLDEIFYIKKSLLSDNNTSAGTFDFKNKIEIKNLDYEYIKSQKILSNLNFEIKKNSMIGIYGESGSGKTTFLKILLGLIQPNNGDILCDSTSIFLNVKSWQGITSFVPQNIYLMDETLKYNLSLSENKNEIDQNRLEKVIKQTNLSSFVENLPNKYETLLGEAGQRISGGQKQRIGIARALYTNPKILILDESTSNLDNDTENQILKELKMLTQNLTIIIVSHRETIKNFCDKVFQLKKNSINEIK